MEDRAMLRAGTPGMGVGCAATLGVGAVGVGAADEARAVTVGVVLDMGVEAGPVDVDVPAGLTAAESVRAAGSGGASEGGGV